MQDPQSNNEVKVPENTERGYVVKIKSTFWSGGGVITVKLQDIETVT